MKTATITGLFTLVLAAQPAHANTLAIMASPPNLLSLIVFVAAVVCLVLCAQVASVVKGGLLSKTWYFFMIGFALLAVSQGVMLLMELGFVVVPSFVVPAVLLAMSVVFAYAVLTTKRTLG